MSDASHLTRISSEFTDLELRCAAATLTGSDPEDVCEVAMVVIVHGPGHSHQIKVAVDNSSDAARIAAVFEHAAAHVRGDCGPCNAQARKRRRHV